MPRFNTMRLALSLTLSISLVPAFAFAQSQDSQSVADAARRAREQKKPQPKPAKVITDEDIKPAPQATAAAPASPDAASATQAASPAPANATSVVPAPSANPGAKDQKDQPEPKEVTDLKAQIKQALADLNLVLREEALEEDKFFSNTDYARDNTGKAKLDDLKQNAAEKQQVLDRLKARLAELLPPADNSAPASAPKQP